MNYNLKQYFDILHDNDSYKRKLEYLENKLNDIPFSSIPNDAVIKRLKENCLKQLEELIKRSIREAEISILFISGDGALDFWHNVPPDILQVNKIYRPLDKKLKCYGKHEICGEPPKCHKDSREYIKDIANTYPTENGMVTIQTFKENI